MLLGAHQSIAGGLEKAYGYAKEDRCEAIQIFTKNGSQWREPERTNDQVKAFLDARAGSPLGRTPVLAHGSYLPNLCSKT